MTRSAIFWLVAGALFNTHAMMLAKAIGKLRGQSEHDLVAQPGLLLLVIGLACAVIAVLHNAAEPASHDLAITRKSTVLITVLAGFFAILEAWTDDPALPDGETLTAIVVLFLIVLPYLLLEMLIPDEAAAKNAAIRRLAQLLLLSAVGCIAIRLLGDQFVKAVAFLFPGSGWAKPFEPGTPQFYLSDPSTGAVFAHWLGAAAMLCRPRPSGEGAGSAFVGYGMIACSLLFSGGYAFTLHDSSWVEASHPRLVAAAVFVALHAPMVLGALAVILRERGHVTALKSYGIYAVVSLASILLCILILTLAPHQSHALEFLPRILAFTLVHTVNAVFVAWCVRWALQGLNAIRPPVGGLDAAG